MMVKRKVIFKLKYYLELSFACLFDIFGIKHMIKIFVSVLEHGFYPPPLSFHAVISCCHLLLSSLTADSRRCWGLGGRHGRHLWGRAAAIRHDGGVLRIQPSGILEYRAILSRFWWMIYWLLKMCPISGQPLVWAAGSEGFQVYGKVRSQQASKEWLSFGNMKLFTNWMIFNFFFLSE